MADENSVKAKIYDYAEIEEQYKPYVVLAYDKKIVNGNHDNCFEPNRYITRAEAGVVAVRLIDKTAVCRTRKITAAQARTTAARLHRRRRCTFATNGSDSNSGSEAQPFATVAKSKTIRAMNASNSLPDGGLPYI